MFPFTRRVLDRTENIMNNQDSFGLEKYGKPLDPMDDYDWLNMAEEELADALKYFNAEREKRNTIIDMVISDIEFALNHTNFAASEILKTAISRLQYLVKKR